MEAIHTLALGGAAGDGVREAGVVASNFLHALGFHTFTSFTYPSLIRGGHNFIRVSASKEKLTSDYRALDCLVALTAESVRIHEEEFLPHALIFVEKAYADGLSREGLFLLPMKEIVLEHNAPLVARGSVALGAYACALGVSKEDTVRLAREVFAHLHPDMNALLVEAGFLYFSEHGGGVRFPDLVSFPLPTQHDSEVIDGNRAIAEGFLATGLEAYVGYPMTPSTSTLQFLARAGKERGLCVVHPEDELAVANMALGMAYAGKRVAVGTANGGFALMQEAFSFAGVAELPVSFLVSMRTGPATGVPTGTAQADLRFVLHAGHGEFPRFVVAPGDIDECFACAADALNLSWKYQVPSIVLTDKHLAESFSSVSLDRASKGPDFGKRQEGGEGYVRYKITEDGISPMVFPGAEDTVVKVTSYEHNEEGEATEHTHEIMAMHEKRSRKGEGLVREVQWFPTVKTYGDPTSDIVLLFWGSTKGAVLEAMRLLPQKVRAVQVLWMEPFDTERVSRELSGARVVVGIEANHTAQLCSLLRERTGISVSHTIRKYDALPFTPRELADDIIHLIF